MQQAACAVSLGLLGQGRSRQPCLWLWLEGVRAAVIYCEVLNRSSLDTEQYSTIREN